MSQLRCVAGLQAAERSCVTRDLHCVGAYSASAFSRATLCFWSLIRRLRGYRSFGSGDGSSLSSGLAALTQPFKLRLARADREKQLKDYATNVVLIEPLASMTAVEDFLWSKVYRSSASPPPSAVPTSAVSSLAGP